MKQTNNIPQGYKDSPLGIIPEEWEVKRIEEMAVKIGDGIHGTPQYVNNSEYYFINGNNLINGCIQITSDTKCVSEEEYNTYKKGLDKSTVLISINGTIGNIAIYNEEKVVLGKSAAYIKFRNDISYYYQFLQSQLIINYFEKELSGSTIRNLSLKSIRETPVILPPLPEQQKIAEILSVWDEAIEKQTQLIAQLETRKRGLMQQLLTGKKRLKGFSSKWEKVKIKEIATEYSIKNKGNKDMTVLSCTKYDGLVPSLEYFGRRVFAEDVSTYKVVPNGYFAYATNHIEEGSIGYQNLLDEALISPMYTVFKTNDTVNNSFIYSILKSHRLIYQYNARMEGSIDRRGGLRWDAFSSIKVSIPSIEEQTAIIQILSSADNEISLAKQKLATLKEQKKGLMQQLLTGKKRVKI